MIVTPRDILFKDERTSLFDNQTELVEKLINNSKSDYKDKDEKIVRSVVNQIVSGRRKLSAKLEKSIIEVLKTESNKEKANYIIRNLKEVVDNYYEFKKGVEESNMNIAKDEFALLSKTIRDAEQIKIFTSSPITGKTNIYSSILIDVLLSKVGVLDDEEIIRGNYEFYFPNEKNLSYNFWVQLYNYSLKKLENNKKEIESKLLKANNIIDNDLNDIRVFSVPKRYIDLTYCLVDSHSLNGGWGFITVINELDDESSEMSVSKFLNPHLSNWKENIKKNVLDLPQYEKGVTDENSEYKKEVFFKDVLSIVKRSSAT